MQAFVNKRTRITDTLAYWTSHFLALRDIPSSHPIIL